MKFEFDPEKSKANQEKHGIDFIEAQELWRDEDAIRFPAKEGKESRFLIIGKIGFKHHTAVATYRDANIRIISVRRSRKKEIEAYERE